MVLLIILARLIITKAEPLLKWFKRLTIALDITVVPFWSANKRKGLQELSYSKNLKYLMFLLSNLQLGYIMMWTKWKR